MKKQLIFLTIITFSILSINTSRLQAQAHEKGQVGITVNAGYSLIGALFQLASVSSDQVSSIPVVTGAIDFGVADRFSIGGAVSYQSLTITTTEGNETVKDGINCVNVGVRPLFHFGNSDDLDLYAGIRVGVTRWSATTTRNDPDFDPLEEYSAPGLVSLQPLFGGTYYFGEGNFGINGEVGFGTYLAALGVKARF